jgi:hypothetical protein
MSKDNIIVFAEVEYRPQGLRNHNNAEHEEARLLRKRQGTRLPAEELELAPLPTKKASNVLSKAPGMQVIGNHENDYVNTARIHPTEFV